MVLLAEHEQAQSRVRQDCFTDPTTAEVPLIRGTVREALRLYPVATFIGRILPADAIVANYEIPQHVRFFVFFFNNNSHLHIYILRFHIHRHWF